MLAKCTKKAQSTHQTTQFSPVLNSQHQWSGNRTEVEVCPDEERVAYAKQVVRVEVALEVRLRVCEFDDRDSSEDGLYSLEVVVQQCFSDVVGVVSRRQRVHVHRRIEAVWPVFIDDDEIEVGGRRRDAVASGSETVDGIVVAVLVRYSTGHSANQIISFTYD